MATTDPDAVPGGWKKATPRFWICEIPLTEVATRLNGGRKHYLVFGEFDTTNEAEVWDRFLKDPVRFLEAEGVPCSKNAHNHILKLPDDGKGSPDEYLRMVEERRSASEAALAAFKGEPDRDRMLTTTVMNHQLGLNPRVAQVLVV
jgi:hypothetical protein